MQRSALVCCGAGKTKRFYSSQEGILASSDVAVSTHLTTVGRIVSCDAEEKAAHLSEAGKQEEEEEASSFQCPTEAAVILEGWQKTWEQPSSANYQGIPPQDVRWLKENEDYGLYKAAAAHKTKSGEIVKRKLQKDKMEFNPPPVPTYLGGSIPNMFSFFTAPVFFSRPVGILHAKIRCPNTNCPAPPNTFLIRKGYSSSARQVCGLKSFYTLLSERLLCTYCERVRNAGEKAGDVSRDQDPQQQYTWLASSPWILMNLAPAVQHMFPAILCGKRSIDRSPVTLLHDRINSVSMSKVQRLIQQGHDEWHMRDGRNPVHRRHKAGIYDIFRTQRHSENCILRKIYGDGQAMQFLTSVLNEWGQFVTTVVMTSDSEDCYKRMARGLTARSKRARAPAPKILYADNHCCCDGGTSILESLFADWIEEGMVIWLDIHHWLHRWDAVVIRQTHAKYEAFMSAMAGALLAYNQADMRLLISAVRNGNKEMYSKYSDEEMISFLKPHHIKRYVHRVTRGVEFKGPAELDIDGIPLFKDDAAVNSHWATASKHLSCIQDPPGIPLYISTKAVTLNGAELNRYKCRRGTNALEGLHAHLPRAVPSQRCGIMPFQVYLISFAVQWNSRMESLRVAGKERQSSCVDPRFEEEQSREEEEEQQDGSLDNKSAEGCDEGISLEDDASEDPIDSVHRKHTVLISDEQVWRK
ncbi:hypothetical protein FQA47_021368 [Oryzias melastigma]|uniref:DUF6729 domain-containing protein n=1 Tax=Oryzias melastigma TaxID=30732 RepID=A0A834CBR8_ORYME|nr:hypothetical protein FQA47_021368 [Oryzias melastigma]